MTNRTAPPLEGILVISVEQAVAAPFATRQLADLGARVIKVERPEGDFARQYDHAVEGESSYFVWLNAGKESICLDLKKPDDAALLRRMAQQADVFVQNLAPGALDRLGFSSGDLREANPRLVTCSISGYGSDSSYGSRKAYDLLIQCETGLLSVTGTPADPAKVGISIADICAGMYAYSGVLVALLKRGRTSVGSDIRVSMFDAMAEWMTQPYLLSRYGKRPPSRTGARHASIAPYGPIACGSGTIFLAVQNEREWTRLCDEVLDSPELASNPLFASNPARVAHYEPLQQLIEQAFAKSSAAEVGHRLDAAGIANAVLRSVGDLHEHPAFRGRPGLRALATPGGTVELPCAAAWAGQPPAGGTSRVPKLGADTQTIRREFSQ